MLKIFTLYSLSYFVQCRSQTFCWLGVDSWCLPASLRLLHTVGTIPSSAAWSVYVVGYWLWLMRFARFRSLPLISLVRSWGTTLLPWRQLTLGLSLKHALVGVIATQIRGFCWWNHCAGSWVWVVLGSHRVCSVAIVRWGPRVSTLFLSLCTWLSLIVNRSILTCEIRFLSGTNLCPQFS